jgi:SAM-dependent methyltransferase
VGEKQILDACCGSRMMWFNKKNDRVLFFDRRDCDYEIQPDRAYPNGTVVSVRPDVVGDFTDLPFEDESFCNIVFDPPHIQREEMLGTVTKKYGVLNGDWREMIRSGFSECFRVLAPGGTLIFKWCEVEVTLSDVLLLTTEQPLYGHRSGKKAGTHWVAFVKSRSMTDAS